MTKITNTYSSFPDQVVPDEVKQSMDYGRQVGMAIEGDWFSGTRSGVENRFNTNYNNLYTRLSAPHYSYTHHFSFKPRGNLPCGISII